MAEYWKHLTWSAPILFVLFGVFLGGMAQYDKPLPTDWSNVELAIGKAVAIPVIAVAKLGYQAGMYSYPYNGLIANFFAKLLPTAAVVIAAFITVKVILNAFKDVKFMKKFKEIKRHG